MSPRSKKTFPTANDLQLLRFLLNDFTALTRGQICRLFPERGVRTTNRRLRKLLDARYLSSHYPTNFYLQKIPLYHLGPKAFQPLELDPRDQTLLRQRSRGKHLRDRNFPHFLLLNDVHIHFLTAERHDPDYKLLAWIPANHPHWQTLLRYRFPLRPDAYAEFQKDSLRFSIFVELDRGTEHAPRLHQKLARYSDYARSGRFMNHFGASRFRVLFIVPSAQRSQSLVRAFQPYPPDLFWVSTLVDFFPSSLFYPIWKTNDSQDFFSLSEPYTNESLPPMPNEPS